MSSFLALHDDDNVLVARVTARAGEAVEVEGGVVALARDIPLAHKIARRPIAEGDVILKYGMPIGIASEAIEAGAHVHVHNIRSGYTPTHSLQDADGIGSAVTL